MSPISRLVSLITRRISTIYALHLRSYHAAVVASDVPGSRTRVHTPAHGGSEAHNGLPDSILPNEPKPLEKHRPPPPQSVLSPDKLSYPPYANRPATSP
ncbi:hypothetical protein Tco_1373688 [Tanacetum coccineum]